MLDTILSVAQVVPVTKAEGPGLRFALWFQGCPLRCPGCCNPEMLPFSGGTPTTVREILVRLDEARTLGVEGITLLGGEPLAHAAGAAILARAVQEPFGNAAIGGQAASQTAGGDAVVVRKILANDGAQFFDIEIGVLEFERIEGPLDHVEAAGEGVFALGEFEHAACAGIAILGEHAQHVAV